MKVIVTEDYKNMSLWAAAHIASRILKNGKKKKFVIGFITGSTPIGMYKELIRMHKEEGLSFKNVVGFNADEYVGLPKTHPESYRSFMHNNLFSHIDIDPKNVHILDGNAKDPAAECALFEMQIRQEGGVDLFLAGVGVNGHIAFNEPGTSFDTRTRLIELTPSTRTQNARFFDGGLAAVPKQALSVGIGTILDAKQIMVLASGENKADAIRKGLEGDITSEVPISAVRKHKDVIAVLDKGAAKDLINPVE